MAAKERSFWSSLPGLLTGLAGILTATVALLGLALSQGWIGDGGAGGAGDTTAGSPGGEVPRLDVEPTALQFGAALGQGVTDKAVTVTNEGNAPISVTTKITGDDAQTFSVDDGDCGGELPPGRSCEVVVNLEGGTGNLDALLVVSANDGAQAREVRLEGVAVAG